MCKMLGLTAVLFASVALGQAAPQPAGAADHVLRVCADPDNLPLSNSRGEGYIGVCDMANQPDRFPITVDYRVSWYPALVMRTPSLMIFPDRTPADLAALLAKAVEFLADR